jgi:hypothetical protein
MICCCSLASSNACEKCSQRLNNYVSGGLPTLNNLRIFTEPENISPLSTIKELNDLKDKLSNVLKRFSEFEKSIKTVTVNLNIKLTEDCDVEKVISELNKNIKIRGIN